MIGAIGRPARGALSLGLATGEQLLKLALELVSAAREVVDGAAPAAAGAEAPPSERPRRERREPRGREQPARRRARARAPDAAPPAVPVERHVDEQAVLAAELAEPGAEEGAGPEIGVEKPWRGYDAMRAPDVVRALRDATPETLAAVQLYEQSHRRRRTVLDAAARGLGRQA